MRVNFIICKLILFYSSLLFDRRYYIFYKFGIRAAASSLLLTTFENIALPQVQTRVTVRVTTANAETWRGYRVHQDPIIGGIDEIF